MQVDLKRYPMADIEKRYSSTVQSGGMWSPEVTREGEQTCRSRHRIAVVVPYRLYFGPVVLCPVHIVLCPWWTLSCAYCTLSRVYFVPCRLYFDLVVLFLYMLYLVPGVLCPSCTLSQLYFVPVVLCPSCTLSQLYFVPLRYSSGSTAAYTRVWNTYQSV